MRLWLILIAVIFLAAVVLYLVVKLPSISAKIKTTSKLITEKMSSMADGEGYFFDEAFT